MPAFGKETLRTVGGLLAYLGTLGVLTGGVCLGALALASPGLLMPTKVAVYGAPTRVRSPVTAETATADTPQTYRIGPPVVHRGPQPPSQAEIAKLRLKATDRELRQSRREMQKDVGASRRGSPPPAEAGHDAAPAPAPASSDVRHSGNF